MENAPDYLPLLVGLFCGLPVVGAGILGLRRYLSKKNKGDGPWEVTKSIAEDGTVVHFPFGRKY